MGNSNRFSLKEEIGKGNFSKIYRAFDNQNNNFVAIKRINKILINENKEAILNEIETMKKLNNRHSIKYIENYEDEDYFNIAMELLDSNLEKELKKQGKFSLKTIKIILMQLNSILYLMHKNNIIHRDLKLENILIKYKNIQLNDFEVKLSDFGLSKHLENKNVTSTFCGTIINMAPEILENKEYNYKIDLWSLGIIIYQMCFNEYPFEGKNTFEIKNKIDLYKQNKKLKYEHQNLLLQKLIYDLLETDVEKRINWEEYFNHPFFNENLFKFDKIDFSGVFYDENNVNELHFHLDEISNLILLKDGRILSTSNKTFKIFNEKKETLFEYELHEKITKIIQLENEDLVFGFKNGEILIFDFNNSLEKQKITNHLNSKIINLYELFNENLLTVSKEKIIFWVKNSENKFIENTEIKKEENDFFYKFAQYNSKTHIINNLFSNYELLKIYENNKEKFGFLFKGKNIIFCYDYFVFYDKKRIYFHVKNKENNEINFKIINNLKITIIYKLNENFILTGHKNGKIFIWKIDENNVFENVKEINVFDENTNINAILVLPNKNILIAAKNIIKIIYINN